ncbi:hypothetical protein AAES_110672 [Amazona aestiva]|uniref:Inactive dipeptidyl peptidase 10 n=1 Tax=Amazona aestiva TaxID=12930 RepID=A0A0Q3PRY9_AMAAE|nr:hypothetical protein AAES_110672 [Amazona aestiva]
MLSLHVSTRILPIAYGKDQGEDQRAEQSNPSKTFCTVLQPVQFFRQLHREEAVDPDDQLGSLTVIFCAITKIYIFENNIYYQPDVKSSSLRLTSSGKEGIIFNGIADWLYEEELLHSHIAHWWSPDGERLAFLTINDSLVPNMVIPRFTGGLYPKGKQYPYPKAGQTNPTVKLFVVNLYGPAHTLELMPPDSFKSREYYITMVKWVSNTKAVVRWLNRPQNHSILTVCETTTGACSKNEEPVFSMDGRKFFMTVPVKQGGRGEFHHIAMFIVQAKSEQISVRHLTSGNWEVIKILAYDENTQKMQILFINAIAINNIKQLFIVSCIPAPVGFSFYTNRKLESSHNEKFITYTQQINTDKKDCKNRWLLKQPFVDPKRLSVFGKGYGGYITSMILKSSERLFKCGAVVAPVTDMKLYASAFSERYLGIPSKEENTYQIYPDEGHNVASEKSKYHLYSTILGFFSACLKEETPILPQEPEEDE